MNWLAHIFLSENNIQFQVGNYLADPLKAKAWENASIHIVNGMKTHKIIDTFTDQHPLFKQSKQRLGSKGLLKGVVIDLTYDYLLSIHWQKFCTIALDDFLHRFYEDAYKLLPSLPKHASKPLQRMIDFELLNKYQSLEDLHAAFVRIDQRLSARLAQRDQMYRYYPLVCDTIHYIEEDFLLFFPQLCMESKKKHEHI
jgi:acyl carrier protein phosphodiesterase